MTRIEAIKMTKRKYVDLINDVDIELREKSDELDILHAECDVLHSIVENDKSFSESYDLLCSEEKELEEKLNLLKEKRKRYKKVVDTIDQQLKSLTN